MSAAKGRTKFIPPLNRDVALLLDALKKIREMGYDSQAARCTDTVLACLRVAEDAILQVER